MSLEYVIKLAETPGVDLARELAQAVAGAALRASLKVARAPASDAFLTAVSETLAMQCFDDGAEVRLNVGDLRAEAFIMLAVRDKEQRDDAVMDVVALVDRILTQVPSDLVLLFAGDVPLLARFGGRVCIEPLSRASFWSTQQRHKLLTVPFEQDALRLLG